VRGGALASLTTGTATGAGGESLSRQTVLNHLRAMLGAVRDNLAVRSPSRLLPPAYRNRAEC